MAPKLRQLFLTLCFVVFIFCFPSHGRPLAGDLISDGVHNGGGSREELLIRLVAPAEEETCKKSYGFIPCTTSALGNLSLIIVYGCLMYLAATCLSNGSELFLLILGPGLLSGLLLPMLRALPDAILILVSGISGSTEAAQEQVSVGMGLLAGSTVLLLTLVWGTCVVVGKCDIKNNVAIDLMDTKVLSLTGSGVTTDIWTSYAAVIMALSVIPFVVVQLPQALDSTSARHLAVLIAFILSISLLISYCLYQVCQPWIQRRRLAFAKHKHVILGALKLHKNHTLQRFLTDEGTPNVDFVRKLFWVIDENNDGHLSNPEIKSLIVGFGYDETNFDVDDVVETVMKEFSTSLDSRISEDEFISGMRRWILEARSLTVIYETTKFLEDFHEQTKEEHRLLRHQSDETAKWISLKPLLLLLLGGIIAAAFAYPLVDAVNNFSSATSIPPSFISFIALPFATNSSKAVSAIFFSTQKKLRYASLTFSELYGAVTMNNILCLSVFLSLVYARGLTWDFSSEVLVVLIVCIVMGGLACFRMTFPLWTSIIAFLLYPFSLALLYILGYVFGWP